MKTAKCKKCKVRKPKIEFAYKKGRVAKRCKICELELKKRKLRKYEEKIEISLLGGKRKIKDLVYERDNYVCHFCGEYGNTIDHLIPVCKGGKWILSNLVCSCEFCNGKKGNLDLNEFLNYKSQFTDEEWVSLKKNK